MSNSSDGVSMAVFVPMLFGLVALVMQANQSAAEFDGRLQVLQAQHQQQSAVVEQSQKLRTQLESIAGATAKLAEQGNPNAIVIRDQLKAQGISINAPGS